MSTGTKSIDEYEAKIRKLMRVRRNITVTVVLIQLAVMTVALLMILLSYMHSAGTTATSEAVRTYSVLSSAVTMAFTLAIASLICLFIFETYVLAVVDEEIKLLIKAVTKLKHTVNIMQEKRT